MSKNTSSLFFVSSIKFGNSSDLFQPRRWRMAGRVLRCGVAFLFLLLGGCGQGAVQAPVYTLNTNTVYVANTGSKSVSAFEETATPEANDTLIPVAGSPFRLSGPPTALAGDGISGFGLVVASRSARTISEFRVDFRTGVLAGPLYTFTTRYTPMGVAGWSKFLFVANLEGSVSAYQVTNGSTVTEVAGSPFPAGSGPVALAAALTTGPGALYVANSLSNNVSGFLIDATTGALTPFQGHLIRLVRLRPGWMSNRRSTPTHLVDLPSWSSRIPAPTMSQCTRSLPTVTWGPYRAHHFLPGTGHPRLGSGMRCL